CREILPPRTAPAATDRARGGRRVTPGSRRRQPGRRASSDTERDRASGTPPARPAARRPPGRDRARSTPPRGIRGDRGSSAAWRVVDAGRRQRDALELFRQVERATRRRAGCRLRFRSGREPQQEPSSELVVIPLVRLDHVAIERRRLLVTGPLAEL